jgi:antitoxin (DNA-binding transcriptional repressor) of toxin-antitoxin stability system
LSGNADSLKFHSYDYAALVVPTAQAKLVMPKAQISKTEFTVNAPEYFRQIETSGEAIIVTDHGKPAFEIRLYREAQRAPLDVLRGSVLRFEDATDSVAVGDWNAA